MRSKHGADLLRVGVTRLGVFLPRRSSGHAFGAQLNASEITSLTVGKSLESAFSCAPEACQLLRGGVPPATSFLCVFWLSAIIYLPLYRAIEAPLKCRHADQQYEISVGRTKIR